MTYLTGPSIRPEIGGFYNLRAGLQCFIAASVDFYGQQCWRGVLLPPAAGTILWYEGGYYAPDRSAHELDVMVLTDPAIPPYSLGEQDCEAE